MEHILLRKKKIMELVDLQFCEFLARNEQQLKASAAIKEILNWANYQPGTVNLPTNYQVPVVKQVIPPALDGRISDHLHDSIQEVMQAFKKRHNQLAIQKLADLVGCQIDN